MGHTYTNFLTHVIFSTKNRLPYLREERRGDVFAYIGGIVRELQGTAINVNGAADHVHALVRLPSKLALAKAVEIVKAFARTQTTTASGRGYILAPLRG